MIDFPAIRARLPEGPPPASPEECRAAGWEIMPDHGFLAHVGPIWLKDHPDLTRAGFFAEDKHRNRRDVVQGGMIMTFADRALATAGRNVTGNWPQATMQLDVHFVSPGHLGEFIECVSTVTRRTRSVMFLSGAVFHDDRLIATANGVWKILNP